MRRCPNPNCHHSDFLFGSNKSNCPFCHSRLIENNARHTAPLTILPDRVEYHEDDQNEEIPFIRSRFSTVECHGRITEIDHHAVFNGRFHKLVNTLFRGEPYQLAHQTIEYTIRVEDITTGYSTEIADFCLFGSYLGRMQVGDEVIIKAKDSRDRRIVKSIYNVTTGTNVKPGLQIPAGFVRGTAVILLLTMLCLVYGVVWLFSSGTVFSWLVSMLIALLPTLIICFGIWYMLRSLF